MAKAPASWQKLANVANKMANLGKGCTQNLTKVDQQWPNLAKMGKMGKKLQCQNMPTIGKSWGRMAKVAKRCQKLTKVGISLQKWAKSCQNVPTIEEEKKLVKLAKIYTQKRAKYRQMLPNVVKGCQMLLKVVKGCKKMPNVGQSWKNEDMLTC